MKLGCRIDVSFVTSHRLGDSAKHQRFLEMLHVLEAAEGRRAQFDHRSLAIEERQAVVEQVLPGGRSFVGKPTGAQGQRQGGVPFFSASTTSAVMLSRRVDW